MKWLLSHSLELSENVVHTIILPLSFLITLFIIMCAILLFNDQMPAELMTFLSGFNCISLVRNQANRLTNLGSQLKLVDKYLNSNQFILIFWCVTS